MLKFKKLHEQREPLVICNVWDVNSTRVAEKLGFQAVGTSSAAMASLLGYKDGEGLSFKELEYLVKRIGANTVLPLSVDLESGYSHDPLQIVDHIKCLNDLGVEGINLEDSVIQGARTLRKIESFENNLFTVKNQLEKDGVNVFLNIRTDTFLLEVQNPVAETKNRIQYYSEAGADGIFVPCIVKETDIVAIVQGTDLPVNVMCMPGLPTFDVLKNLGVKRISMGNFFYDQMSKFLEENLKITKETNSFNHLF